MGVFENVEVLGKSGADLETELLHHETSPEAAGPDDLEPSLGAGAPAGPEVPAPDPGASPAAEAADADAQAPPQS